jgi:hypothetical protein
LDFITLQGRQKNREDPSKGVAPLIYQPLTTRQLQYAEWILLRHRGALCSLPIHCANIDQLVFDSMLALDNNPMVPPTSAVV